MVQFTTKADTLKQLETIIKTAKILPQINFKVGEYKKNPQIVKQRMEEEKFHFQTLIVRSSAKNEDTEETSNAGKFLSLADIKEEEVEEAVEQVAKAMGEEEENQIFIQPYLEQVEMCGVAFTTDPNSGGRYFVLNYDDTTGSTSSVTGGIGEHLKVYYHFKESNILSTRPLDRVIKACEELECLFESELLDIEFAISNDELYILQVRPLIIKNLITNKEDQTKVLHAIEKKIHSSMKKHPHLYGDKTIYGVMPDWNPAEMIGIRPRQLAISLYREIITNGVWAYQRDNYGYQNLRSFPLMIDFCGLPYIDTRVSFNSFLPKGLPNELADKLIGYYLEQLQSHPEWHDKIEFQIAFTCYTFDLENRIKKLEQYDFSEEEIKVIVSLLKDVTNTIMNPKTGLWKKDANKITILKEKHKEIMDSDLDILDKIYWLLEYCKRYGTLPFAGLARAGFIAVEFLRSLVTTGILSQDEQNIYMNSLSTVGKNMSNDFAQLSKTAFLHKYGHLRPGTYDICSKRYDQSGDQYFNFDQQMLKEKEEKAFKLSLEQYAKLQEMLNTHGLNIEVLELFDFMKHAIEGREYAKFVFTHILSDVLELIVELGKEYQLDREELSYLNIRVLMEAYTSSDGLEENILSSIRFGKKQAKMANSIVMPPLIWEEEQIYSFFMPDGEPNFITQKVCESDVIVLPSDEELKGKIVLIKSADPGFDWIFSKEIASFITAYGGANSHMAIRSAEFGIPAVIGVGEKAFEQYSHMKKLKIDCLNRKIDRIQ